MTEIKYINERGIKRVGKLVKGHDEEKIKEGFLAVLHKAGYTVYIHPKQVEIRREKMTEKTYNVFTISNSKLTPEEQVLESQYCYLEEIFHPYVTYLKNNNGMVKTDNFIEDFDPIGLQVISDMEESGIARRMVDKGTRTRKPVDDFMLISFEHWKMFYSAPTILTSKE